MKRNNLGELEELILLVVFALNKGAYAVNIKKEFEKNTGRKINISAVHTALYRMEEKGFLKSEMGEPTAERGGRRKRFFTPTPAGKKVLEQIKSVRIKLWQQIPDLAIN